MFLQKYQQTFFISAIQGGSWGDLGGYNETKIHTYMCAHTDLAHPGLREFCLVKWKEDSKCKLENVISITFKVSE